MDVDWNFELVDQLEAHWQQRLRPRLDGLTDEEYFWRPVPDCWTLRPSGSTASGGDAFVMDFAQPVPDPEPVTTIAWRLAHLIDVFGRPGVPHFDVGSAGRSGVDYSGTAEGALRQLDEGHDAWISDVRSLGTTGIAQPQGALSPPAFADAPIARLIMYTHVELIHHGAEICLLRDLYLRTGALVATTGKTRG